jgi:hypothetical protein
MNEALACAAADVRLADAANQPLRYAFALACVERIAHLLEEPSAIAGVPVLRGFVAGTTSAAELRATSDELQRVANSHRGSPSLDGAAHAAVSATYALANALGGRALEAASYAAYASVYAYGGYAVSDPSAFEPEYAWQADELRRLAAAYSTASSGGSAKRPSRSARRGS